MVRCAVIGCGLMGCKIAGELARHGHRVKVTDSSVESLNSVYQRVEEDKKELMAEGLLLQDGFPGQILCLSQLEEAVSDAEFVFEAVQDSLEAKVEVFQLLGASCRRDAVLATNTLHLDVNEVFARCQLPERCVGLRFLFPVYFIPEVEISPGRLTAPATTERVRRLLEDMGKTLFFRSGSAPLILTEEQREERMRAANEQLQRSSGLGSGDSATLPALGASWSAAWGHRPAPALARSDQECAICLDRQRDCLLAPCHHLSLCCVCAQLLHSRRDFCPVCRQPIQDVIKVYHT